MAVSSVGSTGSTSTNNTISAAAASNSLNQQQFLKLLTTELQNQDPTNPQDEKAFLGQLAQFSTVEGVNSLQTTSKQEQGFLSARQKCGCVHHQKRGSYLCRRSGHQRSIWFGRGASVGQGQQYGTFAVRFEQH